MNDAGDAPIIAGTDDDSDADTQPTDSVDWAALWDEFGFDTPDAVGDEFAGKLQLETAIECSEQGIAGPPKTAHIDPAVEDGTLQKLTTQDGTTRGFAYTVGGAE